MKIITSRVVLTALAFAMAILGSLTARNQSVNYGYYNVNNVAGGPVGAIQVAEDCRKTYGAPCKAAVPVIGGTAIRTLYATPAGAEALSITDLLRHDVNW